MMRTYSRKNSSYLKKAFVASNFNEMCRLCLSELDLGLTPIFQEFGTISYQEWIQYSVDVLIEEGDGLPPNICEECLALIEQTYLFKKKCKASDSKLREHLELIELNKKGKLIKTGLIDMCEDHINLFQRQEQCKSKCDESSAVDSGGTENQDQKEDLEKSNFFQTPEEPVIEEKQLTSQEETKIQDEPQEEIKIREDEPQEETIIQVDKPLEVTDTNVDVEFEYINFNEKIVKTFILKGEKRADGQEEDLTVCEVVPLDEKNEESSGIEKILTYTTLECHPENGHESDLGKPQETKIQEIYQLWGNEEEGEEVETQLESFKEKDVGEQETEKNEGGVMIVDVSWEDSSEKNEKTQNAELLEVNVEDNGVIQLHRVANKNQTEIKKITKTERVIFRCFACGKEFQTGIELRSHLSKNHSEVSDAVYCETCGKSFSCMNNLKRHMSIHTGYKPHKCKICGRTFSQGSILKRHIFTHETLKPFNCQICGKGYTQKMNLLSHFRNHGFRTEGENFSCHYCGKTFMHQSGLSRHAKQHQGIRFSCGHCGKSFGDSSALARHVKTIHSNK